MRGLKAHLWIGGRFSRGWLLWRGGRLCRVGHGNPPRTLAGNLEDLGSTRIIPGFVDTLCHGFAGVGAPTASCEQLVQMARALAAEGVTSVYSGFYPLDNRRLRAAAARWNQFRSLGRGSAALRGGARLEGWHLEGPFISAEMSGALPSTNLRTPRPKSIASLLQACGGHLQMMTLGPELSGARELADCLLKSGGIPSIGHTLADHSICADFARHCSGRLAITHLGNRMLPLSARELGPIGLAMNGAVPFVGVIPDGNHVAGKTLKLWANTTALNGKLMFQSDNLSHAGTAAASFQAGGLNLVRDGSAARRPDGGLAGTLDSLSRMLAARIKDGTISLAQAVRGGCEVPGNIFGDRGVIAEGKLADLVALDAANQVIRTWVGGVEAR